MRLLPRTTRGTLTLAAAAWLAGAAVLWFLLPMRPRAEWKPPDWARLFFLMPDGRTLVTGQWLLLPGAGKGVGPVRLWDAETGRLRAAYLTEADDVGDVMTSADGRWLVTRHSPAKVSVANPVNTFRVLEADTGRLRAELTGCFFHSCLSPDGRLLATSDPKDGRESARWWDIEAGRYVRTFPGARGPFAFSPDGRWFAATTEAPGNAPNNCIVRVWEVASGREVAALTVPCKWVGGLVFSPDGATLAAAGWHRDAAHAQHPEVHAWDAATGQSRLDLLDACDLIGFAPDGRLVVLDRGVGASSVSWWDPRTGAGEQRVYPPRRGYEFKFSRGHVEWPGGRRLKLESYSSRAPNRFEAWLARLPFWANLGRPREAMGLRLLDALTGDELGVWEGVGGSSAHGYGFCTPDGATFITQGMNGQIQLWDVPPRKPLTWFLALAALLALPPTVLARWRVRNASAKRR
jgi:WD40 repeat protein